MEYWENKKKTKNLNGKLKPQYLNGLNISAIRQRLAEYIKNDPTIYSL